MQIPKCRIPLKRVKAFLLDNLGDDQVTIVYGDTTNGNVYFYSTSPMEGYISIDDVYVRNAGSPKNWDSNALKDLTERFVGDARLHQDTILFLGKRKKRELSAAEKRLMNINGSYAWNHSSAFKDIVAPTKILAEYEISEEPDDYTSCHEGAHSIKDAEVIEEATAHLVSNVYMEKFYPNQFEQLKKRLLKLETDGTHMLAFKLAFDKDSQLYRIRDQIKERNGQIR